ncbi:type II CAAX prenyl endopeptidase Rce1 family protein [Streptomyces sp. NPDC059850]|uniref:CPBP family glutamic-type intramembrane protease n=1 Tax=Streptomyces sp. NPDC059850 TaxID=3346970 RepID=UPI003647BE4A
MWALLLLACARPLWISLTDFAALCGLSVPGRDILVECVGTLSALAAGGWLMFLVRAHHSALRIRIAALSALALAGPAALLLTTELSGIIQTLAATVMMTWLALEVVIHHGVTVQGFGLGPSSARREAGITLPTTIYLVHYIAAWAATFIMTYLTRALPTALPAMQGDQAVALGWDTKALAISNIIYTSAMEEVLIVGAVCVLSQAARRPVWQMYAISLGFRVITHLYLGLPALALSILGAVGLFLYHRWGRLQPLVLAHLLFDLRSVFPIATIF